MSGEGISFAARCVPKFDGDYEHWSLIMENLLRSKEYWEVVEFEYTEKNQERPMSAAQIKKKLEEFKLKDLKAKNYLFQAIDKSVLKTIIQKETAKQLWDSTKMRYQGSARVRRVQLQRLRREFETLEMKVGETITSYFGRVMSTSNEMRNYGEVMDDVKIVEKILRTLTLTKEFNFVVCSIEESKEIDKLTVDELQGSLLVHEQKLKKKISEEHLLKVEYQNNQIRGRGRGGYGRSNFGRGTWIYDGKTRNHYKLLKLRIYGVHEKLRDVVI